MTAVPPRPPPASRPDPRLPAEDIGLLRGTDFARPLHPEAARSLATRAFRLLRLLLIGLIVLSVALGFWVGSVVLLLQGLVVALIGFPALAALRVLLDAALTVIAGLHDERVGATRSVS